METEHAGVRMKLSLEFLKTELDIANNVLETVTSAVMDLPAKHARATLFFLPITPVSVQRKNSSTPRVSVFHARLVVKIVLPAPIVKSAKPHWFSKIITVSKDVLKVTSYQAPNVLDAQATVMDVPPQANASTAGMASSYMEVPAILPALPGLSPTKTPSNAMPATAHAGPVPTIQAHVPAVHQEKDTCKLLEPIKSVSRNVLKVLSHRTESAKSVTSDVPNVWVLQETVLAAQLKNTCTMLLVGTNAQESSMPREDVSTNAHQATSENLINNVSNAHRNAIPAATAQLA
jgi:hypothetical protein